jgi:alpha-ketoglutarate-dependent taurine dioxygenase
MTIPNFPDVETRLWDGENGFILFVTATNPERCATPEWFAEHRGALRAALDRYGALYFRGFEVDSQGFEGLMDRLAGDPLPYLGGVSPRTQVHSTVYTSTDAPKELAIVQHHEMGYHSYTPHYVCFYCDTPSPEGGGTPITDGRRFARTLEAAFPAVIDELERKGALFVRNYNEANFKSWSKTWHTTDRSELEAILRASGIEWEWITDDWLRTRKLVPAIVRDPLSGARVLFSCVNLWHRSFIVQMNESVGIPLPDDPAMQPYDSFFGDGTPIPEEFIAFMHEKHAEQMVVIPWQKSDFMVVQNLLTTHGRQSYVPPRKVLVTLREKLLMTNPVFSQPQTGKPGHG